MEVPVEILGVCFIEVGCSKTGFLKIHHDNLIALFLVVQGRVEIIF